MANRAAIKGASNVLRKLILAIGLALFGLWGAPQAASAAPVSNQSQVGASASTQVEKAQYYYRRRFYRPRYYRPRVFYRPYYRPRHFYRPYYGPRRFYYGY
jgi:hypothetical protein